MEERRIEELLAHIVAPPPPETLRRRALRRASHGRRPMLSFRLTWIRAVEAAAMFAMLAGASGRAY